MLFKKWIPICYHYTGGGGGNLQTNELTEQDLREIYFSLLSIMNVL